MICLCAIVKDEARIIERCLRSCQGLIDSYVIVDTGSSDDTMERIRTFPIQGELHERPWVNFGHNRSELLELARGKADYLLLLDADMTVAFDGTAWKHDLNADAYMLRVIGDPDYRLRCLVRGDRRWYSVGATHEYTSTDDPIEVVKTLDAVVICHHCDGSRRPTKFDDDLELLAGELRDEPNNPRTAFYLANTLRDLGRKDEAVEMYRRRAIMGGWEQEVFYALLQAAMLADDTDGLFAAWSYRPQRAEPLYELAWRFRRNNAWHAAYWVAGHGREMPVPDDVLFVHRWMYEWGLEFEYSLAAYWTGHVYSALKACDRLLEVPSLPESYRQQVLANRQLMVPEKEKEEDAYAAARS